MRPWCCGCEDSTSRCSAQRPAPYRNSELLRQIDARYVSTKATSLVDGAAQYGPFDLIFEATGFSPMVFEAMQALGKNGVLVLSSITGGDRRVGVPSDRINLEFVLGNKVLVGTVNANREYFERGVQDMALAEAEYSFHLGKPPDGAWLRIRRYMTCQQLIDFIARNSDNDLSPDERDEFEHHLAACTCSAYLKTYEQTILLAKASADEPVPPEVPESLVKAILAAQSNGPS